MSSTQKVTLEGVTLSLAHPDQLDYRWVGQEDVLKQLLASWLVIDEKDIPLNPRLIGKPGVGKTTLAFAAASFLDKQVYIFQSTMDTRPEDLLISPVIGEDGKIHYAASPLVSAMITGGVCILDEGNRMTEKAWASLAPLLDSRRYIESILAGLKVHAHPQFRFVATMNEDSSTYEIPDYIHSRLQPQIFIDFPEEEEERLILKENLPFVDEQILNYVVKFLQKAHLQNASYTLRDGINIARYAAKRLKDLGEGIPIEGILRQSIVMNLGDGALGYL